MLEAAAPDTGFEVRVTEGGLFIEIARELKRESDGELWFICGRDAAERIVEWDYGHPQAIHHMLDEFGLLVAERQGRYEPRPELAHRIRHLQVSPEIGEISSTEVRSRIARGERWEHLVPPAAVDTYPVT